MKLFQKYQERLEESMTGTGFIRDGVDYHLHKISLKRGGSNIDSPEWLKNKKATINPKNNDDNCLQNALAIALNHKQIKSHPERISKIKLIYMLNCYVKIKLIDQYNWKEIDSPSHS